MPALLSKLLSRSPTTWRSSSARAVTNETAPPPPVPPAVLPAGVPPLDWVQALSRKVALPAMASAPKRRPVSLMLVLPWTKVHVYHRRSLRDRVRDDRAI